MRKDLIAWIARYNTLSNFITIQVRYEKTYMSCSVIVIDSKIINIKKTDNLIAHNCYELNGIYYIFHKCNNYLAIEYSDAIELIEVYNYPIYVRINTSEKIKQAFAIARQQYE